MPMVNPMSDHDRTSQPTLFQVALPLVCLKLVLLLVIILSQELLPIFFSVETYKGNFHDPPNVEPTRDCIYKTWDAQQYLFLSRYGYVPGTMPCAFYPLWPFLIRLAAPVVGGSHLIAGLLLANIISLAGWILFFRLCVELLGESVAKQSLLFLLAYPGAFFFTFIYSESLFFLLSVSLLYLLLRKKYLPAALMAFLLPMTRAVGLFVVLPILWQILCVDENRKTDWISKALCLLAPALGFGVYLLVMVASTGNALEGFVAQRLFIADSSILQIFDVKHFLQSFFAIDSLHGMKGSFFDRIWFLLFCSCLWGTWRIHPLLFWFALPMGLIPAMTVSFMAYMRYLLVVFPFFMVLGQKLAKLSNPFGRPVILAALFALQVLFLLRHINNFWVG